MFRHTGKRISLTKNPRYCLWIIIVCGSFGYAVARSHRYLITPNYRLNNTYVTVSGIYTRSAAACLSKCSFTPTCGSASWNSGTHECQLSESSVDFLTSNTEHMVSWTSYGLMHYDVWHMEGQSGSYTMSFEAARERCEEFNGRMATREEVLLARSQGYEICKCSWMTDGNVGFVLLVQNTCYPWFSEEIINCSDLKTLGRADVFCVDVHH